MKNLLLIAPIKVDLLYLPEDKIVTNALAHFNRLPFFNGRHEVNADTPYLSEEVLSQPFHNRNLALKKGTHLHWALPDALTKGTQNEQGEFQFPAVPNRWLIIKTSKTIQKKWIIESDFLHPVNSSNIEDAANIPNPDSLDSVAPPFRFMGRKLELDKESWLANNPDSSYLSDGLLTAVGHGEPTFAAFYPNCRNVFGMHDDSLNTTSENALQYDVLGWYQKEDLLSNIIDKIKKDDLQPEEILNQISEQLNWNIPGNGKLPEHLLCYGQVKIKSTSSPEKNFQQPKIILANTGTEALSTFLASEIAPPNSREIVEEQLEALLMHKELTQHSIDIGFKFQEARHRKGFKSYKGGILWTILPKSKSSNIANAKSTNQITLPKTLAKDLNLLNELQKQFNQLNLAQDSTAQQLYADWCKYMICCYPPLGTYYDYPDPDEMLSFIENGTLKSKGTIKNQISILLKEILKQKELINNQITEKLNYELKAQPASAFWQVNDPVVLLAGDLVKATNRHGKIEKLNCTTLELDINFPPLTIEDLDLLSEVPSHPDFTVDTYAINNWETQPWHPFLLEWEVEFFPLDGGNNNEGDKNYPIDFIHKNISLDLPDKLQGGNENGIDLKYKQKNPPLVEGANIYSGRSVLTPYASLHLQESINSFKEETSKKGLSDQMLEKIQRVEVILENTPILSQALGGFNEALLMHKLSMQMDIRDPLGFSDYQKFTAKVKENVGSHNTRSPQPNLDFNPIRAGSLKLLQLRLVDTFGQVEDIKLDAENMFCSSLWPKDKAHGFLLPPRLSQAARLNFNFLAADSNEMEMNSHPASSPICGWVLSNHLDRSLMIYDQDGKALGSIIKKEENLAWQAPPGNDASPLTKIENEHLKKGIDYLLKQNSTYLDTFLNVIDRATENIEPANYATHQAQALLMGKPLAIVRTSIDLELMGLPEIHQGWDVLWRDIQSNSRHSDLFEKVKFPVRIGAHQQLNDGLVGYWIEEKNAQKNSFKDDIFYSPQTDINTYDKIRTHRQTEPVNINLAIDDAPIFLYMLLDPRGKIHATSGILPVKALALSADQYLKSLQQIEISFFIAPVLTAKDQLHLQLPKEAGMEWFWLAKNKETWETIAADKMAAMSPKAIFKAPQILREGWLRLKNNTSKNNNDE